MQELQDHLYFDAKRRYALATEVPEPLSEQLPSVRKLMSGELESSKVRHFQFHLLSCAHHWFVSNAGDESGDYSDGP